MSDKRSILSKQYRVTMSDGSVWAVPVEVIAVNRANAYAGREFGGDVQRSLAEDTIPLFEESEYEIHDWASGNMDWDDVKNLAVLVHQKREPVDWQDGWVNGEYEVVDDHWPPKETGDE